MRDNDEDKSCFQTLVEIYLLSWLVLPLTFNLSTQGAEMGRALWIQGQPGLKSEFPDNEGCYTEKSCLTKKKG